MELKVLPSEKAQVYLLFYKPAADDPLLNRVVAFFDRPFCHVELAIPKRVGDEPWDRVMLASSIYQHQTVFLRHKTYDRKGYVSFGIEVSMAQLYKIKAFCRHHADRGTPFHRFAMYAAYLPVQLVHTDATFCSKHVTQALQYADVPLVHGVNPALTTPSTLYKRLQQRQHSPILQIVPSRMLLGAPQKKHKQGLMMMMRDDEDEEMGAPILLDPHSFLGLPREAPPRKTQEIQLLPLLQPR